MPKKKGKNFSTNNATGKRKKSDFYETPYTLTRKFLDVEDFDTEMVTRARNILMFVTDVKDTKAGHFEWSKRGCEATELSFFERSEKKRSSMSQFFFDS